MQKWAIARPAVIVSSQSYSPKDSTNAEMDGHRTRQMPEITFLSARITPPTPLPSAAAGGLNRNLDA